MVDFADIVWSEGVEAEGYNVKSTSQTRYSIRDANDPPLVTDIEAAFGTAAEVGSGFIGVFNPNNAGTSLYVCACDGTNWWIQAMTAAAI